MKILLIQNRPLEKLFTLPRKLFKDKRTKSGFSNRYCGQEWFKLFSLISYSKKVIRKVLSQQWKMLNHVLTTL